METQQETMQQNYRAAYQTQEPADGVEKLEQTLQKFRLGRYSDYPLMDDVMADIKQYKRARSQIGSNGNKAHDFFLAAMYFMGITTPEKELTKNDRHMAQLEGSYRKIEDKLWKLGDQIQDEYNKSIEDLEQILEGRSYAQSELDRIHSELAVLRGYYQMAIRGIEYVEIRTRVGEAADKYKGVDPKKLRQLRYDMEKSEFTLRETKKDLNITAKRLEGAVVTHKTARDEIMYIINRVTQQKYECVEKFLQGAAYAGVDFSEAMVDLARVQEQVKKVQPDYVRLHKQAAKSRTILMSAFNKTAGETESSVSLLNPEEFDKANEQLEGQFKALDKEVDTIESRMQNLAL